MAEINAPKEVVENHTAEEVLAYVVKGLKAAVHSFENSDTASWNEGVFLANVVQSLAYLDALQKKLTPQDPVVA